MYFRPGDVTVAALNDSFLKHYQFLPCFANLKILLVVPPSGVRVNLNSSELLVALILANRMYRPEGEKLRAVFDISERLSKNVACRFLGLVHT